MRFDFLIYTSQTSDVFEYEDIPKIISISQHNNKELGITGALAMSHDVFIQYLEGPREHLDTLYRKIQHDKRHRNVLLRAYGSTAARKFKNWSMRYLKQSLEDYLPAGWDDSVYEYLEGLSSDELLALFDKMNMNDSG